MFLIHSELYFAYILFGLTKYKKVCFLNFGFNLRYFLGVIKYLYGSDLNFSFPCTFSQ